MPTFLASCCTSLSLDRQRLFTRGKLLARFFEGASAGLRLVLWRRAVEEVMRLVVLPLSAPHAKGPYQLHDLILGLFVHMVVVGLPISFSIRRFAK